MNYICLSSAALTFYIDWIVFTGLRFNGDIRRKRAQVRLHIGRDEVSRGGWHGSLDVAYVTTILRDPCLELRRPLAKAYVRRIHGLLRDSAIDALACDVRHDKQVPRASLHRDRVCYGVSHRDHDEASGE